MVFISFHLECSDLVEKAYWRIALADSEEKLERVLDRLLAPVLLKAASENDEVRTRVCIGSHRILLHDNNNYHLLCIEDC